MSLVDEYVTMVLEAVALISVASNGCGALLAHAPANGMTYREQGRGLVRD
jgi:hypothetical protein